MGVKKVIRKIIKKIWGVDGISLFIKKKKKSFDKRIYRKKYSGDELVAVMCAMGMKEGSVIFIHSAMTEFYNYTGTAKELIDKIINVIGEEGTLMMPAYPKNKFKVLNEASKHTDEVDFDVLKTPSGAGYLTEVFRKYPGVKRSINLQHSVCAYGKFAEHFTNEHHLSVTAWDEYSPYYKMSQINTLVFALGLSYFLGTMIHCTESLLKDKYKFFALFFDKVISYKYKNEEGEVGCHTMVNVNLGLKKKHNRKNIINKYFDQNEFHVSKVSNLRIEMVNAKYTLDLYLNLAEKCITMYSKPIKDSYIKNGRFINIDGYKD